MLVTLLAVLLAGTLAGSGHAGPTGDTTQGDTQLKLELERHERVLKEYDTANQRFVEQFLKDKAACTTQDCRDAQSANFKRVQTIYAERRASENKQHIDIDDVIVCNMKREGQIYDTKWADGAIAKMRCNLSK